MEFERLATIIANELNKDPKGIRRETRLKDLDADSLDVFQVIIRIEEELQVQMDPADAEKVRTVGDLADLVEKMVRVTDNSVAGWEA